MSVSVLTRCARLALVLTVLALASCVSGKKPAETYTDKSGAQTVIEGDRSQCERSCNNEDTRCSETRAAESTGVNGAPGIFGASGDCRASLKSCIAGCASR